MRILLVRHAESVNNVLAKNLDRSSGYAQSRKTWLKSRKEDPGLSPGGKAQAELLAISVDNVAKQYRSLNVYIETSPMVRAMETAESIHSQIESRNVVVNDELHEIGGVFSGEFKNSKSKTIESLKKRFADFDYSRMSVKKGAWYKKGFERREQAIGRAEVLAKRLRSKELQQDFTDRDLLVIVSHAEYLDLVLQELLMIPSDASKDYDKRYLDSSNDARQRPHIFRLKNSSHTLLIVKDEQVRVEWINRIPEEILE